MEAKIYYSDDAGALAGPLTYSELRTHADQRRVRSETPVGIGTDRSVWGNAGVRYPELFGQALPSSPFAAGSAAEQKLAGLFDRAIGVVIDLVIVLVVSLPVGELPALVIGPAYGAIMMATRSQTFGMQARGLRAVTLDGVLIQQQKGRAVLRGALRMLSWGMPLLYLIAVVTKKRQTLHDLVSGTIVIKAAD